MSCIILYPADAIFSIHRTVWYNISVIKKVSIHFMHIKSTQQYIGDIEYG